MPRTIRQQNSDLRKAGFVLIPGRGKGSLTAWIHPVIRTAITVSGSDGDDAQTYQEWDVREATADAMRASRREGD
jgi:hypothetical protein